MPKNTRLSIPRQVGESDRTFSDETERDFWLTFDKDAGYFGWQDRYPDEAPVDDTFHPEETDWQAVAGDFSDAPTDRESRRRWRSQTHSDRAFRLAERVRESKRRQKEVTL